MNSRFLNFKKYDQIVNETQEILKFYQCPEWCISCCTDHTLNFEKKEYKNIIKTLDKELVAIIKKNVQKADLLEFYKKIEVKEECPLLENNKCRIYDNKPECCKKFPFATVNGFDGYILSLNVCPLSIQIIKDLGDFYIENSPEDSMECMNTYNKVKDIKENQKGCFLLFDLGILSDFIEFLEKKIDK
jgi:Fe-S-cluster containining protein